MDVSQRARLAAVYSIFAFVTVPFLVFVIPRVLPSLHPADSIIDGSGKIAMSGSVLVIFIAANVAFIGLFFWIYNIAIRWAALERIRLRKLRDDG